MTAVYRLEPSLQSSEEELFEIVEIIIFNAISFLQRIQMD
jgi:hypothetical protein